MRVLSIISAGYEQGGAETSLVAYRNAFALAGHEVRVISSDLRPEIPHYSDIEFKAIPHKGIRKVTQSIFNTSAYRTIRAALQDYQPDVVIIHTMHQLTPAPLFLLKKRRAILCVHGPEAFTKSWLPWYLDSSRYQDQDFDPTRMTTAGRLWLWAHRYPYGRLYRLGLRNIDRFLVFSSYSLRIMGQDGFDPRKVSHLRQGVRPMTAAPDAGATGPPTIVYAGRLERVKGVHDLIAAMPAVLQRAPDARLIIAGTGEHAAELREQAYRLGVTQSVTFLGKLKHSELGSLYAGALVTVVPSIWPETFGKVGVEAMSVGSPVIATDVGGIRDWLRDNENGFLVSPGKPGEIAEAIIRLIDEPGLQVRLSSHARKTAEEFALDKFTRNLLQIAGQVAADEPCAASYD